MRRLRSRSLPRSKPTPTQRRRRSLRCRRRSTSSAVRPSRSSMSSGSPAGRPRGRVAGLVVPCSMRPAGICPRGGTRRVRVPRPSSCTSRVRACRSSPLGSLGRCSAAGTTSSSTFPACTTGSPGGVPCEHAGEVRRRRRQHHRGPRYPLMATGLPSGQLVEIEFTAGVWTDVSADVEFAAGLPIRVGRTSPQSQSQVATFTCQLANQLGKYTPGRQVLTDGTTVHPYWPNVVPRKRIRFSYLDGGAVRRYRFTGYIKSWPPALENGVRPVTVISAMDRMDQLSRVMLQSPIRQEIAQDGPLLWWPVTDDAGSLAAAEQSGHNGAALGVAGPGAPVFGDNGPGFGDGTGVKFAPASPSSGPYLVGTSGYTTIAAVPQSFEMWFQTSTTPAATATFFGFIQYVVPYSPSQLFTCGVNPSGHLSIRDFVGGVVASSASSVVDGGWHHVVLVLDPTTSASTPVYLDGVSVGTSGLFSQAGPAQVAVYVGQSPVGWVLYGSELFTGNVGQVAMYLGALSAARVAAHFAAGRGYVGDTTGARVARFLGYA